MARYFELSKTLAVPALCVCTAAVSLDASANTVDNFEAAALGSTVPTGWTLINPGSGTFSIANNGPSGSKAVNIDHTGGAPTYLVTSGNAIDATQAFSGTFDFYVVENSNYTNIAFYVGDVQDGITGNAGEFIRVDLRERTFGARANILNGAGATIFNGSGNNQYRIDTNNWISASFTWTPISGTSGTFSFQWTYPAQPNRGPMAVNYTFDSDAVYFGFGTQDDPGRYDNISIDGTELSSGPVIPTPSAFAAGLLGIAGVLVRRRGG